MPPVFYPSWGVGVWVTKCQRLLGGVRFLRTLGVGVRFFIQLWQSNWIIFLHCTPNSCLLKWCNFFSNFYWNREFLLCTTIYIDCYLLQNCWQPNFIQFMLRSRKFGVGNFEKVGDGHFTSDSATLVWQLLYLKVQTFSWL